MKKELTGFDLKIIAIVTMLLDHIGAGILGQVLWAAGCSTSTFAVFQLPSGSGMTGVAAVYMILRLTGRIAFPIFTFLIVEGFLYTRDVRKYLARLFLFALISEVPFDLMLSWSVFYPKAQNVFFTLFLSVAAMALLRKTEGQWYTQAAVAAGAAVLAEALHTDYGAFGVLLAILLYALRDAGSMRNIAGAVVCAWEYTAPLAFLPISRYNGKRGKNIKWFFYIFYPAHLLVMYFIAVHVAG